MPDSFIAIDEPATVDKKLDTFQQTVGANVVERERVILAGEGATDFSLPVAHDAADAGNPLKIGGKASAAAPADVSADADRVNAWFLRNGAQAAVLTAAGALIGGDAANGLDVDVTRLPALPAGTNNIGDVDVLTLPALPAGTNNIGDVDVLTLPALPAGTNNIGDVDIASLPGGVSDLDSGAGTDDHAVVALGVAGAGGHVAITGDAANGLDVDVTRVGGSVTVVNGGTFATQVDGAALTALQLIDDPVVADDAAFTPATTKVMMAGFEFDDTTPDSVDEGDAGAARMSSRREIYVQLRDAAGNERGLRVDANGAIAVTGAGGGTQYIEDDPAAANPTGTAPILVRQDTPAALVSLDGDNVSQRGTNYGAAFVQVVSSAGAFVDTFGGGTQYTEDVASVADPVGNQLIARRRDSLSAETTTDGDNTALNSTSKGELYIKHVDSIAVTLAAGATAIGKAEDAASADADVGVPAMAVRKATPANTSGADGDYEFLQISAGRLWASATIDAALPAGTNLIGLVGGKLTFASKATMTWTGTSLANGSARESTVVDNTTNRYKDVRIRFQSKGQTSGTNYADIYVYTALGDTTYTDGATGTDAAFTAANRFNSRYLGSMKFNAGTSAVQAEFQMSDIFETCPDKWGLIIINNTGAALSATAGDHVLEYEGIN